MEYGTQSACLSEAERKIKELEKENRHLKEELASVTSLYNQLVSEGKHERYDERRVTFLKSQLIQLERQLLIFSDALSSRSHVLMEVENNLTSTADSLRGHLNHAKNKGANISTEIVLAKNDVEQVINTLESCRTKIYKNVENNTSEKLARPVAMIGKFIKTSPKKQVTLLDVCSGKTDHLNLKHVAKLESQLSQLYRSLFAISKALHSILTEDRSDKISHLNTAVYISLGGQVASACKLLEDVNQDLLILSVLVPSAPWPLLNRPAIEDLTCERVLSTLPSFPKNKASEGKILIEALMKAVNYSLQIKSLETDVLKQEIHMHQAIYKSQMDYAEALFASLMQGYAKFEKETYELLCRPLKHIMDNYTSLSSTASEESLRSFLQSFKEQSSQIETAIELFTPKDSNKAAFSAYGEAFHKSLLKIQRKCQIERDEKVSNLDELKDYLQKSLDELKRMFPLQTEIPKQDGDITKSVQVCSTRVSNLEPQGEKLPDVDTSPNNLTSRSKTMKEKPNDSGCTCDSEVAHRSAERPQSFASPLPMTKPGLKRTTSLPRFNRRGSQDSPSAPSSPILSGQVTPKHRFSSGIPSPSALGSQSLMRRGQMKKLVLIPKIPKDNKPDPASQV